MKFYARFVLWLIHPALDEHQRRRLKGLQVVGSVRHTGVEQQEAVKRDIRNRVSDWPELHL